MQSASFRLVTTAISTLLLAVLVLVVILAFRDNPTTALPSTREPVPTQPRASSTPIATQPAVATIAPATATVTATEEPTKAAPTPTELPGVVLRVPAGGFAFRHLLSYSADIEGGSATLASADEGGTVLVLNGGPAEQIVSSASQSQEEQFAQFVEAYTSQEKLETGAREPITVDGAPGFVVDVSSTDERAVAGRMVLVQPRDDWLFAMFGVAPLTQWQEQGQQDFFTVLNSVTFFVPEAGPTPATPTPVTPAPSDTPTPETPESAGPTASPAVTAAATDETPTAEVTPSPTTTVTATVTAQETPEPTVTETPTATEGPSPTPTQEAIWEVYTNGNFANSAAVMRSTIWTATSGGVVAWNKTSGSSVKFTTLDGLATNNTTVAENCQLPGLGILFGSAQGLLVFDTQNGSWKALTSANSPMSFDDIGALYCAADDGYLLVGYTNHGLDLFDAESGTWTYLDVKSVLDFSNIRALTVVGDRESVWLATQSGAAAFALGGENQDEVSAENSTLYTTENSPLAANNVNVIAADSAGTVWLAAESSLYWTDGDEWRTYNRETLADSDFPNGRITGLDIGDDGSIWIGSDQAQVCRFDPVVEGCISFFSGEEGMVSGPLTSIHIGPEGDVYYTSSGSGVSMYDGETWQPYAVEDELIPGNAIRNFAEDADNSIWIATNGGAAQLNITGELVRPGSSASSPQQLSAEFFAPDNSPLPATDIRVVQPVDGGVWFGTDGATFFDGDTWTNFTEADGLAGMVVQAITEDDQNRTWLGTRTGLSIWTGTTFFNLTTEDGLPSDDITALLAHDGTVWIGTRGGGLLRFQENQLQVFTSQNINLPGDTVTALTVYNDGSLIIGTERGLARFVDNTISPIDEVPPTLITAIATSPAGEIWAATAAGGLLYFDGTTWGPFGESAKLPTPQISDLYMDESGVLWIGSAFGGIARYIR